jgi:hypothetical protein
MQAAAELQQVLVVIATHTCSHAYTRMHTYAHVQHTHSHTHPYTHTHTHTHTVQQQQHQSHNRAEHPQGSSQGQQASSEQTGSQGEEEEDEWETKDWDQALESIRPPVPVIDPSKREQRPSFLHKPAPTAADTLAAAGELVERCKICLSWRCMTCPGSEV